MDYDVEIDKLIHFLFPEGTNEEYQDNPGFIAYLKKLGSFKVEQLHKEKKILEEEKASIDNQTKHLALKNYKTFVRTADCSQNIHKEVCGIKYYVDAFGKETPKLFAECDKFLDTSSQIKKRRRRNNLILSHSREILQILEIPQFMNTCIRNEYYEEALLLPPFVKRIAKMNEDIPLICSIARDIERSWWDLMRDLLQQLSMDITLPKCLQIIGFLRRMNIFSEVELRLKFIQARGVWLDSLLDSIPSENKNQYIPSVIDITRVNIFSIATQYKAIFTDDEIVVRQNDFKNVLFYSWLNERIDSFLSTLKSDLPFCTPSSLDSLLRQCMYFGQSFGRIGADFRGLATNIFTFVVENNFKTAIQKADEQFTETLKKFVLPKINPLTNIKMLKNEIDTEGQNLTPPNSLIEFYPIAVYCNAILASFNDLRYCNLIGAVPKITEELQKSLENVSSSLFAYYQKENITWLDKEKEIFQSLICCYDKFIGFIQHCLISLFEPQKITEYYGISILDLQKEKLGYLDITELRKPLKNLL